MTDVSHNRAPENPPSDDIDEHAISVTFFKNQYARTQKRRVMTLPELKQHIRETTADSKADLPFLKLVGFGGLKTDKSCLRHDGNAQSVSGLEFDYDGEVVSFAEGVATLRSAGLRGLLCTTASHTNAAPRWRLYLPFSKRYLPPPNERDPVAWLREMRRELVRKVNIIFDGIFAEESERLSQSFYFGNIRGNEPIKVEVIDGEFVDVMPLPELVSDDNPFINYAPPVSLRTAMDGPIDEDDVLSKMVFGENVNSTLTRVCASLVARGWTDDEIVAKVLPASKRVCAGEWTSDAAETKTILRMCASARKKFPGSEPRSAQIIPLNGATAADQSDEWPTPIDLWGNFDPPDLPRGLLPQEIEDFAFAESEMMGVDPSGLAMAALTACAAAINDNIMLKPKVHEHGWVESARLWTTLIGEPSTKKTPIISRASLPIKDIDGFLYQDYSREMTSHELAGDDTAPEPVLHRIVLGDTTVEAAQRIFKDNARGMLVLRDELSGFFGAFDRYNNGGSADRSFWLEAYNGGPHLVDRVKHGALRIPNLSTSILGGIQPDLIRKVLANGVSDDGLIQRFNPILLRSARLEKDEEMRRSDGYSRLVQKLYDLREPADLLRFSTEAQRIFNAAVKQHHDLQYWESINKKFSAHIQKYNGMFARLCIVWHCIKHASRTAPPPLEIDEDTAGRVDKFMHQFLRPHAVCFFQGMLGLSDDNDRLMSVAGYVLSHKLSIVTNRDIQRGDRTMRKLTNRDTRGIFEQLEALGWVVSTPGRRPTDAPKWVVNPRCHKLFADRAVKERTRREEIKRIIKESLRTSED